MPRPSRSVRIRSFDVERRLAEELRPALRSPAPAVAAGWCRRSRRHVAVLHRELGRVSATKPSIARRSFRSSSSSPCSSATRKAMLSTPSCASLRSSMPRQQQRPHLGDGGAHRVALLAEQVPEDRPEIRRAGNRSPAAWRARRMRSLASPAAAMPERSPLMSAANTGTPAREKPSASTCRVTVLPVPVAPVTRPCRLPKASVRYSASRPCRRRMSCRHPPWQPHFPHSPVCLSMRPPTWRARVGRGTSAPM